MTCNVRETESKLEVSILVPRPKKQPIQFLHLFAPLAYFPGLIHDSETNMHTFYTHVKHVLKPSTATAAIIPI